jgi:AcrR family transcriptional regulator
MGAFWRAGYSATSLDDLTAATGMNRPSLYGAFGDKRALYLAALDRYTEASKRVMGEALSAPSLAESLRRVYEMALSFYLPEDSAPRGCFLISTATVESIQDEEIRGKLRDALKAFDQALETRIRQAQTEGEVERDADAAAFALIASSVLHSLAVRSRAGDSRAALNAIVNAGISFICSGRAGPTKRRRGKKR